MFELWLVNHHRVLDLMKCANEQNISVSEFFISTVLKTRIEDFTLDRIYRNSHGKPEISDCSLSFNLSHSGENLALVLCNQEFCGVDIQLVESSNRFENAFKSVLCDRELSHLEAAGSDEDFFRLWSLKEAYIKAIGGSIWYGRDYDFTPILDQYGEKWTFCNNLFLYSTEIYKGVFLSLCAPVEPDSIDFRNL